MPIHDWTRVRAGILHHFHQKWIGTIADALNELLPPNDYYALAEQVAAGGVPDVLTLEAINASDDDADERDVGSFDDAGGLAVLAAPPRASVVSTLSEADLLLRKRNRVAVRHAASGDRVVALLEVISPGNKSGRAAMRMLLRKSGAALRRGVHLTLLDLHPPGPFDPRGIHDRLWTELGGEAFIPPPDRPLTLAAYRAADGVTAYVEPTAVGLEPVDVPLFFTPDRYVNVPLADTYAAAYNGVPQRWRRVIEGET